jgi:hypothetical protein
VKSHTEDFETFCVGKKAHVMCTDCIVADPSIVPLLPFPEFALGLDFKSGANKAFLTGFVTGQARNSKFRSDEALACEASFNRLDNQIRRDNDE